MLYEAIMNVPSQCMIDNKDDKIGQVICMLQDKILNGAQSSELYRIIKTNGVANDVANKLKKLF